MPVLLSTYGGRGDVEPLVAVAVRLRAFGAEVRACAPPDWAERLARFGVPLVPVGPPVRSLMHGARHGARRSDPDNRVPVCRAQDHPDLRTRVRATAMAGTIRTDGATVAAKLLLDAVSRDRPPVYA
jgi:hypothetical protein